MYDTLATHIFASFVTVGPMIGIVAFSTIWHLKEIFYNLQNALQRQLQMMCQFLGVDLSIKAPGFSGNGEKQQHGRWDPDLDLLKTSASECSHSCMLEISWFCSGQDVLPAAHSQSSQQAYGKYGGIQNIVQHWPEK